MVWLSKSSVNTYLQCPCRWKLQHIDKIQEPKGEALIRGSRVHELIERFYTEKVRVVNGEFGFLDVNGRLGKLKDHEMKRLNKLRKMTNNPRKYFFPIMQEEEIANPALKLRGRVDAVFVNTDEEYICMDWKSGRWNPNKISGIRREMAFYKILLDNSGKLDKPVKYIAQFYTDAGKMFFEEVKAISVKACWKAINKVRESIEKEKFEKKCSPFCRYCGYFGNECKAWEE